jgi:hypothetical protein
VTDGTGEAAREGLSPGVDYADVPPVTVTVMTMPMMPLPFILIRDGIVIVITIVVIVIVIIFDERRRPCGDNIASSFVVMPVDDYRRRWDVYPPWHCAIDDVFGVICPSSWDDFAHDSR